MSARSERSAVEIKEDYDDAYKKVFLKSTITMRKKSSDTRNYDESLLKSAYVRPIPV